jgi:hypothetical protein
VYIIWKWFWGDEVFTDTPNTPFDRNDEEPSVSCTESVNEDDNQEETTHAVVFKSVLESIRVKVDTIQKVLEENAEKLREKM